MSLKIVRKVIINNQEIIINNQTALVAERLVAEDVYRSMEMNYAKFFKMDILCKWAMIGAEFLLKKEESYVYEGMDKTKIAVVLMTHSGCIDVDKKYSASTNTIPSPALFVYTLPNIMLGEICIRHGFKGEQFSLINDEFDKEEIAFLVNDLLQNRKMDACLFGWVNADSENTNIEMNWTIK